MDRRGGSRAGSPPRRPSPVMGGSGRRRGGAGGAEATSPPARRPSAKGRKRSILTSLCRDIESERQEVTPYRRASSTRSASARPSSSSDWSPDRPSESARRPPATPPAPTSPGRSSTTASSGRAPRTRSRVAICRRPARPSRSTTDRLWCRAPRTPGPVAPAGIQGRSLRGRPRQPATHPHRAERRSLRRRERGAARSQVFAASGADGRAMQAERFASGLQQAVRDRVLPAGRRSAVGLRRATPTPSSASPTRAAICRRAAQAETVVPDLPGGGHLRGGGHWTRDLAFSRDGKTHVRLGRVAVERRRHRRQRRRVSQRADVLAFDSTKGPTARTCASTPPESATRSGSPFTRRAASSGSRSTSAIGWATTWSPTTSPTSRRAASTAGPGTTSAAHQDPRHAGKHPELAAKVIVPDVLLQPHDASLEMTVLRRGPVSRPSTGATSSPPSTGRGTARCAAGTR